MKLLVITHQNSWVRWTIQGQNLLVYKSILQKRVEKLTLTKRLSHLLKQILLFTSRNQLGQGIRLRPLTIFKESVYKCTPSTFTAS